MLLSTAQHITESFFFLKESNSLLFTWTITVRHNSLKQRQQFQLQCEYCNVFIRKTIDIGFTR